jgi:hypothetical protein
MHIKGLGLGGLVALVALVGCGSSGGAGGTGGSTGSGGLTGGAGITGNAGATGSAGKGGNTGTGGSGGAFTTTLPSGTKITALTSAQATQLCNDLANYDDHTFIPTICSSAASASGLTAAYRDLQDNSAATTVQLRADCAAASADSGTSDSDCLSVFLDGGTQTCDISSTPSACQATVGDFTKCTNDRTAAALAYYASFPSCSSLTATSLSAFFAADGGVGAGATTPTSCSMFDSTCSTDDGGTAAMTNMSPLPMPRMKR